MDRKMYLTGLLVMLVTGLLGVTAVASGSDWLNGSSAEASPLDSSGQNAIEPAAAPASQSDTPPSVWSSDNGGSDQNSQSSNGDDDDEDEDDEDDEDEEDEEDDDEEDEHDEDEDEDEHDEDEDDDDDEDDD